MTLGKPKIVILTLKDNRISTSKQSQFINAKSTSKFNVVFGLTIKKFCSYVKLTDSKRQINVKITLTSQYRWVSRHFNVLFSCNFDERIIAVILIYFLI